MQKYFPIVAAIMAICAGLWELYAAAYLPHQTISEVTLRWSMAYPVLAFLVGMALGIPIGHLFWPQLIGIQLHIRK